MEEATKSRLPLHPNTQKTRLGGPGLGIPQLIGLVVLVLFLPWVFLTVKNERDIRNAIDANEPFRLPGFAIKFSKTLPFDSLGFQGKGIEAGFWKWTPAGLQLEDKGRSWFSETPETITSLVGAGKRRLVHVDSSEDQGDERKVLFRYEWTEIAPPVQALLFKPPQPDTQYQGIATFKRGDSGWQLESVKTPDFDQAMSVLLDNTAGIKR